MTLQKYLNQKPLYYKEIDYNRIHIAYNILKPKINSPKTIHIVGTNGKGSTGRILAHLSHLKGMTVGHYSSPHILKFNERIWINGKDSSDIILDKAHKKLFEILGKDMSNKLTYFEYSTLLAFVVFEHCELIVLEAGLGGEFDATNVCDKELSIITPIGIDHQDFLGNTIKEIATTKINSIQKQMLLAPQPYNEVFKIATEIATEKKAKLFNIKEANYDKLLSITKTKKWADYLISNTKVAINAMDILNIPYNIEDIKSIELFGRFYPLTTNIRIDVGHNPLAATAIKKALDKDVVLIYNSLDDKDYKTVLSILKPKIKRVEIIPISSQRATTLKEIENTLTSLDIKYKIFNNQIDKNENYLVFGSFYVVEKFLTLTKRKEN